MKEDATREGPATDLVLGEIAAERFGARHHPAQTYAPPAGLDALRLLLARIEKVTPDRIVITAGASMALTAALADLPRPAAVAHPVPYYPAYPRLIGALGLRAIPYPVAAEGERLPAAVKAAAAAGAHALILNLPGNPLGNVAPNEALDAIAAIVTSSGLRLILDEVYAPLVYEAAGNPAERLAIAEPVRIRSLSKLYGFPGDRIGYVVASPDRADALARTHWALAMNAPVSGQLQALNAIINGPSSLEIRDGLLISRDIALAEIVGVPGVRVRSPAAGLFVWLECPDWTGDSTALAAALSESNVKVLPGMAFGVHRPACLRASFAIAPNSVGPAFAALAAALTRALQTTK